MKLIFNVWPQDALDRDDGTYRISVDDDDECGCGDLAFTRDQLVRIKNGEPIEVEFNYPQGGVRL